MPIDEYLRLLRFTLADDKFFSGLVFDCTLRREHKKCALLDYYIVTTGVKLVLDEELGFRAPIGPDPSPEENHLDTHGTQPMFFPLTTLEDDTRRVEVAVKLHSAMKKIIGELEANINELKSSKKG